MDGRNDNHFFLRAAGGDVKTAFAFIEDQRSTDLGFSSSGFGEADAEDDDIPFVALDVFEILDEKREGRKEFEAINIPRYSNMMFGMFGGEETKVTLEAENDMISVMIDRFGKDIIIAPISDTHFRTTVTVAVSNHFLGWIMSLEGDVRIVAPDSVVEQMKDAIARQAERYGME